MDEIEACCSRLGIMVNGQLRCFGSAAHLKNTFAQGFTLDLKLTRSVSSSQDEFDKLNKEIKTKFSPCLIKDKHGVSFNMILISILSV
jgi:ABC-type multidrug transport system ATPase subunit